MVRNRVKKKNKKYNENDIFKSQEMMKNEGKSIRAAAIECGIPFWEHSMKNFQKHLTMNLKFTRTEGACLSSRNCLPW